MAERIMFYARGHPNVSAMHKTTLEFTKEDYVSPKGDCIVGVEATFDKNELKRFARNHKKVRMVLKTGGLKEVIHAETNSEFDGDRELVVRMGHHTSARTFAVHADKAAKYLDRELVRALKTGSPVEVDIEEVQGEKATE